MKCWTRNRRTRCSSPMPGGACSAAGAATCAGLPSRAAVDDRVQPPDVAAQHVRERRRHLRDVAPAARCRSEEHTSDLQSLMRISYAVFRLKKKRNHYMT